MVPVIKRIMTPDPYLEPIRLIWWDFDLIFPERFGGDILVRLPRGPLIWPNSFSVAFDAYMCYGAETITAKIRGTA